MAERYFEEAQTQYDEFMGTCAFDEPHSKSLEEVFELPKEKYWVLGFSLFGGAAVGGLDNEATAYVVERSSIFGYAALEETAIQWRRGSSHRDPYLGFDEASARTMQAGEHPSRSQGYP
jgi:hypothetical protein